MSTLKKNKSEISLEEMNNSNEKQRIFNNKYRQLMIKKIYMILSMMKMNIK